MSLRVGVEGFREPGAGQTDRIHSMEEKVSKVRMGRPDAVVDGLAAQPYYLFVIAASVTERQINQLLQFAFEIWFRRIKW